jgi:uncharacterized protein (DUF488 family)
MIYTIGHSNHSIEYFLELLQHFDINVVVEVRSNPRSLYSPHFDKRNLMISLYKNQIKYLDMGKTLGGRPFDKSVLNILNKIEFDLIENKEWYSNSIERLIEISQDKNIAILCSEENPSECHRGYIITKSLLQRDQEVIHIRGDKSSQKAYIFKKQGVLQL